MKIGKLDLNPLCTFILTVVCGFTFAAAVRLRSTWCPWAATSKWPWQPTRPSSSAPPFNCILVEVLAMPLKKVLKR